MSDPRERPKFDFPLMDDAPINNGFGYNLDYDPENDYIDETGLDKDLDDQNDD